MLEHSKISIYSSHIVWICSNLFPGHVKAGRIGKLVMQLILDHSLKWWAGDYFEEVAIMQSEDVLMNNNQ